MSRSPAIVLCAVLLVAGCDKLTPPTLGSFEEQVPTEFIARNPDDLEQRVNVKAPPIVEDAPPVLGVSSIITNKSTRRIRVIIRSCMLLPDDVITSFGRMAAVGDPGSCDRLLDTLDLEPGAATATVSGQFIADVTAGVHQMTVQQSYLPNFNIQARFRKK